MVVDAPTQPARAGLRALRERVERLLLYDRHLHTEIQITVDILGVLDDLLTALIEREERE